MNQNEIVSPILMAKYTYYRHDTNFYFRNLEKSYLKEQIIPVDDHRQMDGPTTQLFSLNIIHGNPLLSIMTESRF